MASEDPSPHITRRDVDRWLSLLQAEISGILRGPAGELRARLVLIERRISRWRGRLGIRDRRGP